MGERIKQLREKQRLSRYELARRIQCEPVSLMLWEEGTTTPTARSLDKLARYFGVTVDYILNGGDAM